MSFRPWHYARQFKKYNTFVYILTEDFKKKQYFLHFFVNNSCSIHIFLCIVIENVVFVYLEDLLIIIQILTQLKVNDFS